MTDLATNVLSYADNLDILRRYLPDAAVDLVYLDPPFNSNRDDNVIFRDESGKTSDARLLALQGRVPDKVSTIIAALRPQRPIAFGLRPRRHRQAGPRC
jgi:16S rRNA G966 N2-methylase RsmD